MTILVVDDVVTDGMLLSSIIARQAHDVIAVDCPLKGLQMADDRSPSLVIVDYMMPKLDGVEFIRRLRAVERHRFIPVVMVTASDKQAVRLAALEAGATEFLTKPVDPHEWIARVRNLLDMSEARRLLVDEAASLRSNIVRTETVLADQEIEFITRLCRATRYRDPETAEHSERSALLARGIARVLKQSDVFCRHILLAMQMHDVGKIGISDLILNKPGALSAIERAEMEKHVLFGANILRGSSSEVVRLAEEIAVTHHERWDGRGYPHGISGTAIPLAGRIAAVADVFDALTSWRPYKKTWHKNEALQYFQHESGQLFDPLCVNALSAVLDGWEWPYSSEGQSEKATLD